MPFPPLMKEDALFRSKRTCCICKEFAGRNTNVHHIHPEAEGGPDTIDNAAVLCLSCHGDVGHYNPKHPIGNKYGQSEVRQLRDEWWEWCKHHPFAPGPKDPLTISPAVLGVPGGDWEVRHTITLYNRTENTLYAVWVRFYLSPGGFRPDEIVLERPDWATMELELGASILAGDFFGLPAKDDQGNNFLNIVVRRISPKTSLTMDLKVEKPKAVETGREIPIRVIAWSDEPKSILQVKSGKLSMAIKPPDNIIPLGIHVFWIKA